MQLNTNAKKILFLAILILAVLLLTNIGLLVRINQLSKDKQKNQETIKTQEETIARYESSSNNNYDEQVIIQQ